jgi:hypothetical protein
VAANPERKKNFQSTRAQTPSYINVMTASRPFTNALELLRAAHLRPTRQRLALVRLLFEQGDRPRHRRAAAW